MGLEIIEKNGTFHIAGKIDLYSAPYFKSYLEENLSAHNSIKINTHGVTAIDKSGIKAIKSMYKKAFLTGKSFFIVGYGCKDIFESFRVSKSA